MGNIGRGFPGPFARVPPVELVQSFDPIEAALQHALPADYKGFLMWSNGGETMPPLSHYSFYPLEQLLQRYADGVPPNVLEFATDGSVGFAFDLLVGRHAADYPVVSYPLGDTTRDDLEFVAERFSEFLDVIENPAARYRRR
jgi:hypothetical protein